jgi:hypothetical protein
VCRIADIERDGPDVVQHVGRELAISQAFAVAVMDQAQWIWDCQTASAALPSRRYGTTRSSLSTRPPRAQSGDAVGRENARARGVLGIGEIQPLRAHSFGSSNLLRARHTELAQSNFKSKNKIYQPPKRICHLRTAYGCSGKKARRFAERQGTC